MAEERQRLREWATLISYGAGEKDRFFEMLVELLEADELGEVQWFRAGRRTPELVRVTRRDMEADTTAEPMGRHLQVSWAFYYRPTWSDRLPNLFRTVLTDAERVDVRAFATVALSATYSVAADLATELGQPRPEELEASGVLGALD